MTRYMVIEHFLAGNSKAVYDRFFAKGRLLPDGLHYVDSWLGKDDATVYQLMETQDPGLFEKWSENWSDLARFEIVELKEKPTGEL